MHYITSNLLSSKKIKNLNAATLNEIMKEIKSKFSLYSLQYIEFAARQIVNNLSPIAKKL